MAIVDVNDTPGPDETYLCRDCKFARVSLEDWIIYFGSPSSYSYKCTKTRTKEEIIMDPVTGPIKIKSKLKSCSEARCGGEPCGTQARHWSPKHKKDLFKLLKKDYTDE